MVPHFKIGDLVWAKIRGFPHWPASITSCPKNLRDVNAKYEVLFFGTRDCGTVKFTELLPYLDYISKFEVKRKLKGFNEALKEIREAAGLEDDIKPDIANINIIAEAANPTTSSENISSTTRVRKPSSRINNDDFIIEPTNGRNRSSSKTALAENNLILTNTTLSNHKSKIRTDSLCSNTSQTNKRTKHVSYSGLDLDYESLVTNDTPIYMNDYLSTALSGFEDSDDEKSRSRKRTQSKIFDDFLISPSKRRDRSISLSSNGGKSTGGRSRYS